MEVWIKPGDPAQLADYMDVMRDSPLYHHYFAPDESVLHDILADALERGALLTAVNSSGEVVGLMQCEWRGMFGAWPYLALLGVKKRWRGMGVGHKLLDTFERISRKMEARQIFICVSAFNPRARALYTSLGYRKVTQIPALYRDGVTENVLMKRL